MPLLADIYSRSDAFKRKLIDALRNPRDAAAQMWGDVNDRARVLNEMTSAAAQEQNFSGPATMALATKLVEGYNPGGMTIGAPSIVRGEKPIQGAVVKIGDKLFLGRTHGDALNRAVYEGVVQKQNGKYIYPKDQDLNMDLFMTKEGNLIDRFGAYFDHDIGASETAIEKGIMQNTPARSMSMDAYRAQIDALRKNKD